jgi:hypothetical protein
MNWVDGPSLWRQHQDFQAKDFIASSRQRVERIRTIKNHFAHVKALVKTLGALAINAQMSLP